MHLLLLLSLAARCAATFETSLRSTECVMHHRRLLPVPNDFWNHRLPCFEGTWDAQHDRTPNWIYNEHLLHSLDGYRRWCPSVALRGTELVGYRAFGLTSGCPPEVVHDDNEERRAKARCNALLYRGSGWAYVTELHFANGAMQRIAWDEPALPSNMRTELECFDVTNGTSPRSLDRNVQCPYCHGAIGGEAEASFETHDDGTWTHQIRHFYRNERSHEWSLTSDATSIPKGSIPLPAVQTHTVVASTGVLIQAFKRVDPTSAWGKAIRNAYGNQTAAAAFQNVQDRWGKERAERGEALYLGMTREDRWIDRRLFEAFGTFLRMVSRAEHLGKYQSVV